MSADGVTAFDLERYLKQGVEKTVKGLLKLSEFHPAESAFMARFAKASQKAARLRAESAAGGRHVPPFLIASVTSVCNLHCAGCYARSLDACTDGAPVDQMTADDWERVFGEARALGIAFILLAGGEPLVRRDVIERAAKFPEILFPVFTNGTMLRDELLTLFDRHRNLVPVMSIEGGEAETDARRGEGVYRRAAAVMQEMRARRIAFGASITVTKRNLAAVTSDGFLRELTDAGCKAVIYVEFVPTNHDMAGLAPDDCDRQALMDRLAALRSDPKCPLLISFPGDEKSSGGCLAAGRGFFHINSHGGAEPCPFSPYSDISLKDHTLIEALDSRLFRALGSEGLLRETHRGGCVLYERREAVEALLASQ